MVEKPVTISNVSLPPFPSKMQNLMAARCSDIDDVKKKTTEALSSIKEDKLKKCFDQWNKRLDKCISINGEYFEGD